MSVANTIGVFIASRFKSMAFHAIEREARLADRLVFQKPHSMKWGYTFGLFFVFLVQVIVLVLSYIRYTV